MALWLPIDTARSRLMLPASLHQRVERYRRELETGTLAALRRPMRDLRSDRKIRRLFGAGEPLPAKDIDRLVDFYARSLAGYSEQLETDLYRRQMSQQRVLRQWEEKLWASPESARRAVKIWQTRDDDRVREAHRVMDGVAVPFESQFVTPDAGLIVAPPYSYGCRCFVKVVVLDGELERGPGGSVVLPEGVV